VGELLHRLGGLAARRHWIFLIAWVIILGGLLGARHAFGGEFVNNYTVPGSQSSAGLDALNAKFPQQGGYAGQIVFHARQGTVSQQSAAVNQATANVGKLPDVIKAASPFNQQAPGGAVSKEGTIAYSTVSWNTNPAGLDTSYLNKLNKAVQPARAAGLQVEYGANAGLIGQSTNDLKSEVIGLACALLLLIFMFGSLVTAAIPLVSAIFSVGAGLSLVGLLGAAITFPTTAPTVATLLGLGVAVDYGLFLVARHRENVDTGMDIVASVAHAEATAGSAVVVAGSTVVVSILGLYVSGVPFVGSLGLASAIVVAVTMLAALTLVPAFMGIVKGNIRALSARIHARRRGITSQQEAARTAAATQEAHEHSAFARWGRRVSRQPWPWAIASTGVLLVLAIPLLSLHLGQPDAGTNPTTDSSRRAFDLIAEGFGPGANGPLTIVAELPKESSSTTQQTLSTLQKTVAGTPGVASVTQPVLNQPGDTAVMNVIPTTSPQATATQNLVDNLRDNVLPKVKVTTLVTGTTAGQIDFTRKITSRMIALILVVVAIAFVLLTMAFRSVVIAIKAAVLNLLSIGAAYGVIVAVFQWGWAQSLIGLHTTLPIPAYVPMMVFAIVFGLSMDYEVFLLSRVHEAWLKTHDSHRSVAIGIGSTARVITTAAGIMVVVFLSFVLNSDPTIKMLALGMAVAVFIDASIVRMTLVPSVMSLLGEHAWWMPHWMERFVPHLQLEGPAEEELEPAGTTAGSSGNSSPPAPASAPASPPPPASTPGSPGGSGGSRAELSATAQPHFPAESRGGRPPRPPPSRRSRCEGPIRTRSVPPARVDRGGRSPFPRNGMMLGAHQPSPHRQNHVGSYVFPRLPPPGQERQAGALHPLAPPATCTGRGVHITKMS
jgi:putative drug exporter of the RND superfamily